MAKITVTLPLEEFDRLRSLEDALEAATRNEQYERKRGDEAEELERLLKLAQGRANTLYVDLKTTAAARDEWCKKADEYARQIEELKKKCSALQASLDQAHVGRVQQYAEYQAKCWEAGNTCMEFEEWLRHTISDAQQWRIVREGLGRYDPWNAEEVLRLFREAQEG